VVRKNVGWENFSFNFGH
jgi:hypothetical protein